MKHPIRAIAILVIVTMVFTLSPARTALADCVIGSGTVALSQNGLNPYYFMSLSIPPGESATLTVSGTGSFASGFIPGPGGGHVTTFYNPGPGTISTQAAIVVGTAGTFSWSLSASNCSAGTWFNSGDGRVNGLPGDRIAVYCNTSANPPNLDIWGVGNDSQGFRLLRVNFSDLVKTGNASRNLGKLGTLHLSVDAHNNFSVVWTGRVTVPSGSFVADGVADHGFAKSFQCDFPR